MRLTLRKFKYFEEMSEETLCFHAEACFDGKPIATVSNEGHGGPNMVHDKKTDYAKMVMDALRSEMKEGNHSVESPNLGEPLSVDEDFFFSMLAEDYRVAKILQAGNRNQGKKINCIPKGQSGVDHVATFELPKAASLERRKSAMAKQKPDLEMLNDGRSLEQILERVNENPAIHRIMDAVGKRLDAAPAAKATKKSTTSTPPSP